MDTVKVFEGSTEEVKTTYLKTVTGMKMESKSKNG